MNGYWKNILQEVTEKDSLSCSFRLTNRKVKQTLREEPKKTRKIPKRYYLSPPYQEIYFTSQEALCLLYCYKSSRYKFISKALNISERTVEFYLKNMRRKINCRTKKELLTVAIEGKFFDRYHLLDGNIEKKD